MKIHGLRIYPQSVDVVQGVDAPIFVHGSVSDECSEYPDPSNQQLEPAAVRNETSDP